MHHCPGYNEELSGAAMPHIQHLPSAMAALRPTTAPLPPPSIRAGVGTWVGTKDRTAPMATLVAVAR
eukprot:6091128-Prymnesium_polylepis.1